MEKKSLTDLNNSKKTRTDSTFYIILKSLRKNRTALIGTFIVTTISILALLAPVISPYNPKKTMVGKTVQPPSLTHLLGTDEMGRDLFSRLIWGGRTALYVGISVMFLSSVIGIIIGSLSGYFMGAIDSFFMRLSDILVSLPNIILIIAAISMLRIRGINAIILIQGFLGWMSLSRIVRSEFLTLKERPYIEASKVIGVSDIRIIFRDILPNALTSVIVVATINVATYILTEASLSFLGLGDASVISWGSMLNAGKRYMSTAWWMAMFPGIFLFLTSLGLNLMGDGLRDALDVKARMGKNR
jgi:peptide/nickel transport system permease protein